MKYNNELIELVFPPEEENVTWVIRNPLQPIEKPVKSESISSEKVSYVGPYVQVSIKSNCAICKKMIETSEYSTHLIEEHPVEYQKLLSRKKFGNKKLGINHQNGTVQFKGRGFEIQNRLTEIKAIINSCSLTQKEINEITEDLLKFQDELENKTSLFLKTDNIPAKLNQIKYYLSKLNNIQIDREPNASKIIESKNTIAPNQNGQTPRGIEIQKMLSDLQEETKRKDLNPIEKENLQKTLTSLQKEMTEEIEKFTKFDSIPIRLNQVANYLERLKEKEPQVKKETENNQKIIPTQKEEPTNNKKHKMQVIWRFGL